MLGGTHRVDDELYQAIAEVFELLGVHIAGRGAVLRATVSKDAPDAMHDARPFVVGEAEIAHGVQQTGPQSRLQVFEKVSF